MQNTINAFLDGIITDQNPLTMPETALTSALNATIITGNGNEGLLQNDMGNTLIKDSITGGILSLNDGFVPIGMKEHGGILYIASYNPETNEGELGSIPSPIIHYDAVNLKSDNGTISKISDLKGDDSNITEISVENRLNTNTLFILSDKIFHGGDKFIVSLDLDLQKDGSDNALYTYKQGTKLKIPVGQEKPKRTSPFKSKFDKIKFSNLESNKNISNIVTDEYWYYELYPQVTTLKYDSDQNVVTTKGWFKIELYAILNTGKEIRLENIEKTPQTYYTKQGVIEHSKYWFLEAHEESNLDSTKTRTNDLFRTYPNIPAGRLGVKFVPEYPSDIEFGYNSDFESNLPQIIIDTSEEENIKNYIVIPSLTFTADCPIRPDMIKMVCNNGEIQVHTFSKEDSDYIIVRNGLLESEASDGLCRFQHPKSKEIFGERSIDNIATLDNIGSKFIISKYVNGILYLEENYPVQNFTNKDCDGLFYVQVDKLDSDLDFTCYLYTRGFDNDITNEFSDLEDTNYVLYKIQSMPRFNAAKAASKDFEIDVNPDKYLFFDITWDENRDFDIELFRELSLKCFLYQEDDKKILEFDESSHKYIEKGIEHTYNNYVNFKTFIYPQYVSKREEIGNIITNKGKTRFIWNQIQHGPCNFANKEQYTKAPATAIYGGTIRYFKDTSNYLITDANRWEWFVVSPILPTVRINLEDYSFLLPILRPKNAPFWRDDLTTQPTRDNNEVEHNIILDGIAQRKWFLKQKNFANLSITDLKNNMLFCTNLTIADGKTPLIFENIEDIFIGKLSTNGVETFFKKVLNLYPDKLNVNLDVSSEDFRQGLPLNRCITAINNNLGSTQGEDPTFGDHAGDRNKRTPIFYDYCARPGFDTDSDNNSSMHDTYFSHISSGSKSWASVMFGYANDSDYNKLDYWQDWKNYNNGKTAWYCTGFITEAIKKCPGYILAGTDYKNIIDTKILNYNFGINYLYKDPYTINIINGGFPATIPNFPIVVNKEVIQKKLNNISNKVTDKKACIKLLIGSIKKENTLLVLKNYVTDNGLGNNEENSLIYNNLLLGKGIANPAKIEVNPNTKSLQFKISGKVSYKAESILGIANDELYKTINDNLAMIISPLFFIAKNDGLTHTNKSDYKIADIINLTDNDKGFALSGSGITSGISLGDAVVETNETEGQEKILLNDIFCLRHEDGSREFDLTAPGNSYISKLCTFCKDNVYYFVKTKNYIPEKYFEGKAIFDSKRNYNFKKGWYVACVTYNYNTAGINNTEDIANGGDIYISLNQDILSSGSIAIDTQSTNVGKFEKGLHYIPFYIKEDTNNAEIHLCAIKTYGTFYLRGFGIYPLNPRNNGNWDIELKNAMSILENDFTNNITFVQYSSNDQNIHNLYKNIIFKGVACFKEMQVSLGQRIVFNKIGCLEKTYFGFEQLPTSPSEECVFTYALNTKNNYNTPYLYRIGTRYSNFGEDQIAQAQFGKIENKQIRINENDE